MRNIQELLAETPNISVTVTVEDLRSFATEIVNQTIASLDKASKEETVWLSQEQVAKRLNINPTTLWRWGKTGYLVGTKFGNKLRYKESDVARIESSEKKGGVA